MKTKTAAAAGTDDWWLAVNGFSYWANGHATVSTNCLGIRSYKLDFKFVVADRYNWDVGKIITLPDYLPGIELIKYFNGGSAEFTDKFMASLHRAGNFRVEYL